MGRAKLEVLKRLVRVKVDVPHESCSDAFLAFFRKHADGYLNSVYHADGVTITAYLPAGELAALRKLCQQKWG